jgi:hypothetical protein
MSEVSARFWNKSAQIAERWEVALEPREFEGLLLEVLELVKANPNEREFFVRAFLEILNDRSKGPLEILVFCMRELRWTEIRSAAIEMIRQSDDPRTGAALDHLLAVYEPIWEDAFLYSYYSNSA